MIDTIAQKVNETGWSRAKVIRTLLRGNAEFFKKATRGYQKQAKKFEGVRWGKESESTKDSNITLTLGANQGGHIAIEGDNGVYFAGVIYLSKDYSKGGFTSLSEAKKYIEGVIEKANQERESDLKGEIHRAFWSRYS